MIRLIAYSSHADVPWIGNTTAAGAAFTLPVPKESSFDDLTLEVARLRGIIHSHIATDVRVTAIDKTPYFVQVFHTSRPTQTASTDERRAFLIQASGLSSAVDALHRAGFSGIDFSQLIQGNGSWVIGHPSILPSVKTSNPRTEADDVVELGHFLISQLSSNAQDTVYADLSFILKQAITGLVATMYELIDLLPIQSTRPPGLPHTTWPRPSTTCECTDVSLCGCNNPLQAPTNPLNPLFQKYHVSGMNRDRYFLSLARMASPPASRTELVLYSQGITDMTSLHMLPSLTVVNLHGNKIKTITGLDALVNLQRLDLSSNSITAITGLDSLRSLVHLDISANRLTTVTGLRCLFNLHTLVLAYNQITSLAGLADMSGPHYHISSIELQGNHVGDMKELLSIRELPHLQALTLSRDAHGNPVCRDGQYRTFVFAVLPTLHSLDCMTITGQVHSAIISADDSCAFVLIAVW